MTIWNKERILKLNKNSLGGIVTAGQISANDMIIWTMLMLPINIILYGAGQCFVVIGLFVGTVFVWLFLSRRIRSYAELSKTEIHNAGDFFLARYQSKSLKYVISILWVLFSGMLLIAVLQFAAGIISDYLEISDMLCVGLIILALLTVIGIVKENVIYIIKVLAFSVMIVILMLVVVSVFTIYKPSEVLDIYGKTRLTGGTSIYLNIMYYDGRPVEVIQLISMLGAGISCIGMPFIFKGMISVKDNKELDRSRVMAMVFTGMTVVISSVAALLTVVCIYPLKIDIESNVFQIYNLMLQALYQDNLYGDIFRISILSVYMLLVLILAGSLMRTMAELLRELIPEKKKTGPNKNNYAYLKDVLVILMLGIIIFFLVWFIDYDVQAMITLAWNLSGSALAAPCFACFMWKQSTRNGIYAGILSGILGYLCWQYAPLLHGKSLYNTTGLNGLVVAAAFSLMMIEIVSAVTTKPDGQELKVFEQMRMQQK